MSEIVFPTPEAAAAIARKDWDHPAFLAHVEMVKASMPRDCPPEFGMDTFDDGTAVRLTRTVTIGLGFTKSGDEAADAKTARMLRECVWQIMEHVRIMSGASADDTDWQSQESH